jgi:hypothetical protein
LHSPSASTAADLRGIGAELAVVAAEFQKVGPKVLNAHAELESLDDPE